MAPVGRFIEQYDRFIIVSHVMPDGDSVGSSVALRLILEELGKRAEVVLPDAIPPRFDFMTEYCAIHTWPECGRSFLDGFSAVIVLDCSGWQRVGGLGAVLEEMSLPTACLDHHHTHEAFAQVEIVDSSASSTAVLVRELARDELFVRLRRYVADALYVAIMTETGSFSYGNTTSEVFSFAADLVERGVHPQDLQQKVNERFTIESLEFIKEGLACIHTEADGTIAFLSLPHSLFERYGARIEDAFSLGRYVRGLQGVKIAAMLYEDEKMAIKTSFRSRGDVDVSVLARHFDGGGHRAAAGAVLASTLEDAERDIIAAALPMVEQFRGSK